MTRVICSMNVSVDGYVTDPDGGLNWTGDDRELFRYVIEETRGLAAYVMGRRLYETMLYWEDADLSDPDHRAWAEVWLALPKLVFSRTLTAVTATNARLATGGLAEELAALPDGEVSIGGAALAAEAARLGLIDEWRPRVHPVLVGGGTPFWPAEARRVQLELLGTRAFPSQATIHRYAVRR